MGRLYPNRGRILGRLSDLCAGHEACFRHLDARGRALDPYASQMVALTFDDGPDPVWTPRVLEELRAAGDVRATFFVVAEQLAEREGPALLRAILDAGHCVQAHCSRHVRHSLLSHDELRGDIEGLLELLASEGVPPPSMWRPPYGDVHPALSCLVADRAGVQLVRWTHDTWDYDGRPASAMLASLAALEPGDVVLMHDSRRYSSRTDDAANTVELIAPLVELIARRDLTACTLTRPLAGGPPELLPCGAS